MIQMFLIGLLGSVGAVGMAALAALGRVSLTEDQWMRRECSEDIS